MDLRVWAAQNLAARLLAGPWTLQAISSAIAAALGPIKPRTRAKLTVSLFALGEDTYPQAAPTLVHFLLHTPHFAPAPDRRISAFLTPPRFAPIARFTGLAVPALATLADLATWLDLSAEQLDWLSDERRTHGQTETPRLQNYHFAFATKHDGRKRLIEAPKPRLKTIQRKILHTILNQVPVHPSAHGFVPGRSCRTGAQIHANEAVLATFDLAQFFPGIGAPRIHGLFRCLGYPWPVARRLTGLCTTITPAAILRRLPCEDRLQSLHALPHLAQGAPTSPALANLLAFPLDLRLSSLARAAGANFTRYADDLAFSGNPTFAKNLTRFSRVVGKIVSEEGFSLNLTKTRVMLSHTRQSVTGITVNAHCNIPRAEYDALKATLHNCVRTGPTSQNLHALPDWRARLQGRIAWVQHINPARAEKLWHIFDQINWPP